MKCKECAFYGTCKKRNEDNLNCYPRVFLYGLKGNGGIWKATGVPKKYRKCTIDNLPFEEENPKPYALCHKYAENIVINVLEKNLNLYICSKATSNNPLGTGVGKTTLACSLLNHFTVEICREYLKGNYKEIFSNSNPSLFVKCSDFQNYYNALFRGTDDQKTEASVIYYGLKSRMKNVPLLVMDDIGIRNASEGFLNELYEVIDARVGDELTTFYTSNVPLNELDTLLDARVMSRISENTTPIIMGGKDRRSVL